MAEWQASMSTQEFRAWDAFYAVHPFDDRARFHRPAALVASAMGGRPFAELLDILEPSPAALVAPPGVQYTDADANTFRAFGMRPPVKRG